MAWYLTEKGEHSALYKTCPTYTCIIKTSKIVYKHNTFLIHTHIHMPAHTHTHMPAHTHTRAINGDEGRRWGCRRKKT